jgi:hypothetical protein
MFGRSPLDAADISQEDPKESDDAPKKGSIVSKIDRLSASTLQTNYILKKQLDLIGKQNQILSVIRANSGSGSGLGWLNSILAMAVGIGTAFGGKYIFDKLSGKVVDASPKKREIRQEKSYTSVPPAARQHTPTQTPMERMPSSPEPTTSVPETHTRVVNSTDQVGNSDKSLNFSADTITLDAKDEFDLEVGDVELANNATPISTQVSRFVAPATPATPAPATPSKSTQPTLQEKPAPSAPASPPDASEKKAATQQKNLPSSSDVTSPESSSLWQPQASGGPSPGPSPAPSGAPSRGITPPPNDAPQKAPAIVQKGTPSVSPQTATPAIDSGQSTPLVPNSQSRIQRSPEVVPAPPMEGAQQQRSTHHLQMPPRARFNLYSPMADRPVAPDLREIDQPNADIVQRVRPSPPPIFLKKRESAREKDRAREISSPTSEHKYTQMVAKMNESKRDKTMNPNSHALLDALVT